MIRTTLLFAAGLLTVGAAMAFAAPKVQKPTPPTKEELAKYATAKATITTKFGKIVVKFFPDLAPIHVKNFITLAEAGFYNGTTFHRVIPGFMIQGGDPNTKDQKASRSAHGTGGPGYTIKAEFNDTSHARGVVSMARAQDPDSAGSQFFVCVADARFLDRQYSAFGRVVRGMDVADKIVGAARDSRDNPHERIEMKVRLVEPAA